MMTYFVVRDADETAIGVARAKITENGIIGNMEARTRKSHEFDAWLSLANLTLSEENVLNAISFEQEELARRLSLA